MPLGHVLAGCSVELGLELDLQVIEVLRDVLAGDAGCQLADVADAALRQRGPLDHAHLHPVGTSLHVVLGQALHAAQLAQRVEVADHGHVRICRLAEAIEQRLGGGQECRVDPNQHRRSRTAGGADPEVAPSRLVLDRSLDREVVVLHVQPMRWEYRHAAHEDVVHLLAGFADRSRRRDDLRLDRMFAELPAAQLVDGGLIQPDHGAKRPADQVELVLDDQVRWTDRADVLDLGGTESLSGLVVAIAIRALPEQAMSLAFLADPAEQRAHLASPRHHGELVHGGDHHRRGTVVDLLVHDQHRNARVRELAGLALREVATALLVAAVDEGAPTPLVDLDIAPWGDFRATPGATGQLRGRRRARRCTCRGCGCPRWPDDCPRSCRVSPCCPPTVRW